MFKFNQPAIYAAIDVVEEVQAALFDEIKSGERGVITRADYDQPTGNLVLTTNGEQRWIVSVRPEGQAEKDVRAAWLEAVIAAQSEGRRIPSYCEFTGGACNVPEG